MSPASVYALYVLFALGGAALVCLLPRGTGNRRNLGILLGFAAVAGLMTILLIGRMDAGGPRTVFYISAAVALVAGTRVVTHSKPVYSAIYFVLVVLATAAMLLLQAAEFLAVALVIIYAGAILVTYLFVIMLSQQPTAALYDQNAREPMAAVLVGFVLVAVIAGHVGRTPAQAPRTEQMTTVADPVAAWVEAPGNTAALGASLFTRYVVVLELSGILLLVSMVGAIALSRKKVVSEMHWPARPLGQIGREVEPF